LPKLNRLNIKTQIINKIKIPDMIDQILYPESASPASPAVPLVASGAAESDKKFNESVNGAVIDSAEDDSAGKLIVVVCCYLYLLIFTNIIFYYYLL
jgi:hypothetical protein